MTKLTSAQTQILVGAATAEDGGAAASGANKATIAALVRRGLIISEPRADEPGRLIITEAGRAAIAPEPEVAPNAPPHGSSPPPFEEPPKAATKVQRLVALLRRTDGAGLEEMMAATGWQAHSVRGALSGAIKKGLGLNVVSERTEAGRRYSIPNEGAAA